MAISCSCQFRRLDPVLFRLLFRIPTTASFGIRLFYIHFWRAQRKTQPVLLTKPVYRAVVYQWTLYCCMHVCCGNAFTKPLPSNGYARYNIITHGYRVRALVVSCRLPFGAAWVRSQVSSCGICSELSNIWAGFLWILRLYLPIPIPPSCPRPSIILSSDARQ
jgi:hypothetical protein